MRQVNRTMTGLAQLMLTLLMALLVTCGESPTGPGTSHDYMVYFNYALAGRPYARLNTATRTVDSVVFPRSSSSGMAVAPGGSRVFLGQNAGITVVSAESLEIVAELNYENNNYGIAFSHDNKYMAVAGDSGLYILSGSDYGQLYHYPGKFFGASFARDGRTVYCIATGDSTGICRTSISAGSFQSTVMEQPFPGFLSRLVVSPDENTWYAMVSFGSQSSRFIVYDVVSESVVYSEDLVPGHGDIEITPNGRYVFFSNPGTIFSMPTPNRRLAVFDTRRNEVVRRYAIGDYVDEDPPHEIPIGSLAITPDGRHLIALSGPLGVEFAIINAITLEFEDYKLLGYHHAAYEVVCE